MTTVTLVTAVFDLGRDTLAAPFRRDADHYRAHLPATLDIDCPMVIYTESAYVELVKSQRAGRATQIIVSDHSTALDESALRCIEAIRHDPRWLAQADWLPQSPQAALAGYNPLVMSKLLWLAEVAKDNPFGSQHCYWIDAGLGHTVSSDWLQAAAIRQLPQWHRRFLLLCFPYAPVNEVHGFAKEALAELAGVEETRWVARGGFFGGERKHVADVAVHYRQALAASLEQGLMGTEESLFTLLSYRWPDLFDLQVIEPDGLVWPFFHQLCTGWQAGRSSVRRRLGDLCETWFVSFNAPEQFELLLQSISQVEPELLCTAERVLIDNTTDASLTPRYAQLCAQYGIRHIQQDNIGINGARLLAAEQFYRGGRHAMFWFEDDMLLIGKDAAPALCRNDLPRHVPDVATASLSIQQKENADYVKFSFTEVNGSHDEQWGWECLSDEKRQHYFPGISDLPPALLSAPQLLDGAPYVVGEVFYGNWPQLITRRGTKKLLLDQRWEEVFESYWAARSFELLRSGELRAAVFLASPVEHCRIYSYAKAERRESLPTETAYGGEHSGKTIFVSIANYRDSEAPHTLRDLFAKAAHPQRIFVGIFSQVVPGVDDDCLPAGGYPAGQVRELRIDAAEGLGACWARHRILSELMADEDYVLQIDSHSRFVEGWDDRFIAMLHTCPSARALLTTYPTSYRPPAEFEPPCTPVLAAYHFNDRGILLLRPQVAPELEFPPVPLASAFLSGNCLFGPAAAFREVPYDPWLYFHGEEISLAVRFWTHGWDLFAPNDHLMYTDYSIDRGRPRHWTDQKRWAALNHRSFIRLRHLFGLERSNDAELTREIERYDLGRARSLKQYEAFADVCFATHYIGARAEAAHFSQAGARPLPLPLGPAPAIFVAVVNYRDRETPHTLSSLFSRAARPERIVVGVLSCLVPGEDDDCLPAGDQLPDPFPGQVRELRLPAAEGQGIGWARQRLYAELLQDEAYVLQIDSCSRFAQGWDDYLLARHAACSSSRAVLSSYPPAYQPPDSLGEACIAMPAAHTFTEPGILALHPHGIHINDRPDRPIPGAFVFGGSLFGPVAAFREVPCDPHIVLHGEDATHAARLWTHGWDIFAINGAFMYRDYDTKRPQPWQGHPDWQALERRAHERIRHLLGVAASRDPAVMRDIERYGLGERRSLAEYQAFADVDFATGRIGTRAADGLFPPPLDAASRVAQRRMRQAFLHGPHDSIETRCGDAARLYSTRLLREQLADWLEEAGVRRLIDAGCGDLMWLQRTALAGLEWYAGYDIVPELIQANQALFAHRPGFLFGVADIARTAFAPADAILCRRTLNLMRLDDARQALNNFIASGSGYLLATTHPGAVNIDAADGRFRALDLCAPPFNLPEPLRRIDDYRDETLPVAQSCLALWRVGPGP